MPHFSKTSLDRLKTCDPRLIHILHVAIRHGPDFSVICGHRDKKLQNYAFQEGTSQVRWPHSYHNHMPSSAVDVAPYPIDWDDIERFQQLGHYLLGVADGLGIHLGWGGDWKRTWILVPRRTTPGFVDYPHFQVQPASVLDAPQLAAAQEYIQREIA